MGPELPVCYIGHPRAVKEKPGSRVFNSRRGGGVDRAPQNWAEKTLSVENGQFFFRQCTWQMMTFLSPVDALIPKIPSSFGATFWVPVTSKACVSVLVGFWGPVN